MAKRKENTVDNEKYPVVTVTDTAALEMLLTSTVWDLFHCWVGTEVMAGDGVVITYNDEGCDDPSDGRYYVISCNWEDYTWVFDHDTAVAFVTAQEAADYAIANFPKCTLFTCVSFN